MIYNFTTTDKPDVSEVGGKDFSLMRMTQAELSVPPGFSPCRPASIWPWSSPSPGTAPIQLSCYGIAKRKR